MYRSGLREGASDPGTRSINGAISSSFSSSCLCRVVHLNLESYYTTANAFDLSSLIRHVLISHFHVPFVTIMGRNLFGDMRRSLYLSRRSSDSS